MERPSFRDSKTAFVIISWNSAAYIEKCVESVLALQCRKLDVWVVDNGSTDPHAGCSGNCGGVRLRAACVHRGGEPRHHGPWVICQAQCSDVGQW
ncbi:glycosyltransferase family 2 protein [Senegalimassilia anaerobia]|uniref:Glycosyltransferase 2-like domain-containing protein n=1 Tax=Senegalimassilia anaerobia TaxID=1473216 RepID=A0A369LEP1_9ACTN|nr:hypothetical protein C1880_01730 [Senegalimassilia anaerobia]